VHRKCKHMLLMQGTIHIRCDPHTPGTGNDR
jgi:hypothetical protein